MDKIKSISINKLIPAFLITAFLAAVSVASILAILLPRENSFGYTANIYQNGVLVMSIPLDEVQETQHFTLKGDDGCTNEIEVRPGCIGIIAADCPDKICVNQGFISDSRLPVTCLPNRVVIELIPSNTEKDTEPDMITY